jgi:hypothetical protein
MTVKTVTGIFDTPLNCRGKLVVLNLPCYTGMA